jgi:hypothetical protein
LLLKLNDEELTITQEDTSLLVRVGAAHRTAWETFLIVYAAQQTHRRTTPFTSDKLRLMLGGADVAEGRNTIARDTQFELYIAAMFTLAGASVSRGEPDLRFLFGPEKVGVAAKRVSSLQPAQLKRHVNKAVEQIRQSRLRGFVAVNLDSRFGTVKLSNGRDRLIADFEQAFDELNVHLTTMQGEPNVIGVMVHGYVTEWSFENEPPTLATSAPFRWHFWPDDAGQQLLFDQFSRK